MKFVITNLDPKGFFLSASAYSVDTLSKVKDFACCSLDRYYFNKKYKFCVRKD